MSTAAIARVTEAVLTGTNMPQVSPSMIVHLHTITVACALRAALQLSRTQVERSTVRQTQSRTSRQPARSADQAVSPPSVLQLGGLVLPPGPLPDLFAR